MRRLLQRGKGKRGRFPIIPDRAQDIFFRQYRSFKTKLAAFCLRDHQDLPIVFKAVTVYLLSQKRWDWCEKSANNLLRIAKVSAKKAIVPPVEGIAGEYWFIAWEYAMCQMLHWYICAIC